MDFLKMIIEEEEQLIEYRRYFHAHPELSGLEYATLETIKAELKKMKIDFIQIPDGGLLGFIGDSTKGKTILLRGDVDALPIHEEPVNLKQERSVVSQREGVSHMCGHDAHTAMLLMEAKLLKEIEQDLEGQVIICFEQGEEGTGFYLNILDYLDNHDMVPDSVYAAHVQAAIPSGLISIEPGPVLAGAFPFNYILEGQGGHGSRPDLANSPIDCFVAINEGLSTLRMKKVSPFEILTYSIGLVHAGTKANVIPNRLKFGGTVRFFQEATAREFQGAMDKYVAKMATAYGLKATKTTDDYITPPCLNTPDLAQRAQAVVTKYLGEDHLIHALPWMVSETFAVYLNKYSGVFALLGITNEELGTGGEHHNSCFDVDEAALKYGVAGAVAYAYDYLNN